MSRTATAKNGFDKLAHIYRCAEYLSFGPLLMRCRVALLSQLKACSHALVLGDGDGRFTVRALRTYPNLRITAIDISPGMLRTLEHRATVAGVRDRLITHCADVTALASLPSADIVVTHFFLDCLTTEQVCALSRKISAPRWLISDFDEPHGRLRLPARALIRSLYAGFRVVTGLRVQTLPAWREVLLQAGFQCVEEHQLLHGLLIAESWQRETPHVSSPALAETPRQTPGPLFP